MYTMGPKWCDILWATENIWDYYWWSLSTTYHSIESSSNRKKTIIFRNTRISDFWTWYRLTYVVKSVMETLEVLNWEFLLHPPYSPDLVPSDYHLFRSMKSAPYSKKRKIKCTTLYFSMECILNKIFLNFIFSRKINFHNFTNYQWFSQC